ncbi:MAG: PqqD family protein [Gammaproteobacteria bacterium]|nr:PqqD family protein [Gammaproteobacteria bacterium]MDH3466871.1 PqqD family protein [Gammaproteobacteria bacterium]
MSHYQVASTTLRETIDDEMVLLNLDSGEYFGLDANGRRFFEVLCEHSTIDDSVACLQSEYDVDSERLARDFRELVNELLEHGLLERSK